MKKQSRKRYILSPSCILFLFLLVMAILIISKRIAITPYFASRYEVQGIDLSHYQGEVDWDQLRQSGISFAFIKATEGSRTVDERFSENWQNAAGTGLCIGAYHFFSFDSPAEDQAALYKNTVGNLDGRLPPVLDVEYYGKKEKNPPEREKTIAEIQKLLDLLEIEYQVKPILYTTYPVYHRYIQDNFDSYPLWIRNVYYKPGFDIGRDWLFWQYSDTSVMEGYQGEEPYIDRNVFAGSKEELKNLCIRR